MSAVVVRFSSLGDVVLAGSVTGALAPVTFVTLDRYAAVAERLPGVEQVLALAPGQSLSDLARKIPRGVPRVDLHGSLRSRALALAARGGWARLDGAPLRRRLRVAFKGEPPLSVEDRYAGAAGVPAPAPPPWIRVEGPGDALLLVPGAAHATKRWPAERFAQVGQGVPGPVLVLGGPDEVALCRQVARDIGTRAQVLAERGFERILPALGRGRHAVGGDTGLTHLCRAAGVPTVVIFGPTTSRDGFWRGGMSPVEAELPCRPCSRFGSEVCPVGDHLCMDRVQVEQVLGALS